jgi:hypothetical protein
LEQGRVNDLHCEARLAIMSGKENKWSTVTEGAFADSTKTLENLNALVREKVLEAVESGRYLLHKGSVLYKAQLGQKCAFIRKKIGDRGFEELVEKYWLTPLMKSGTLWRELEIAQQIYHFSRRKGKKLRTDIPVDAYLRILSYVRELKSKKAKNHAIHKINETGRFNEVDISRTKELRAAITAAKVALKNSSVDQEAVCLEEIKELREYAVRFGNGLANKMEKAMELTKQIPLESSSTVEAMRDFHVELGQLVDIITESHDAITRYLKKSRCD